VEEDVNEFFGAPREKEGKIDWRNPENVGQVDLGFRHLGFWHLGFWTPRFRPKVVGEIL
jgi:hypothetical protein